MIYKNLIELIILFITKMNFEYIDINIPCIKYIILYIYISIIFLYLKYFFFCSVEFGSNNLPAEAYSIYKKNETMVYLKRIFIKKFNLYIQKCLNQDLEYNYPLLNNPKISAIMPLYNAEKFLKYSLSSIQNQNMKEIEIILIDDNSTDNTLSKVYDFMKKDNRIRLIN